MLFHLLADTYKAASAKSAKLDKKVRFSSPITSYVIMDHDEEEGVGYIAQSHYAKAASEDRQAAVSLLQGPIRQSKSGSFLSSNVNDIDVPIYSTDNLTGPKRLPATGLKEDKRDDVSEATTTPSTSKAENEFNGKLAFAVAAAALGSSFQHGYNTGVLNNPQFLIEQFIEEVIISRTGTAPSPTTVTTIWSIITSIFCVGGMFGGAITGFVGERFGRKGGLLLNNILVVLAVIFEGTAKVANSYEMIIVGRFLIGINSGLNAGLAPMYLSEISPVNLRGAIGSVYQLVITISILVAQVLGLGSILGTAQHWPTLLVLTVIPAAFQLATLPICPESPKYLLLSKNKEIEAQRALSWLRGSGSVQDEMDEMRQEYEAAKLMPTITTKELVSSAALRIPLIISLVMMLAQQFSGINAVIFYSTRIFTGAGLSTDAATYATLAIGAINVLMTIVSVILVEKAGRKTLLLIGFGGMVIDTLLLTIALQFAETSTVAKYLCVCLVIIFIILFATGPGSIPWFLVSELFNQSARPAATSLAVSVNWIANFVVTIGFPTLQEQIGSYVFIIFTVILVLVTGFIYKKVPETKNKTMEEISAMFRQQSYK